MPACARDALPGGNAQIKPRAADSKGRHGSDVRGEETVNEFAMPLF